MKKILVTQRVEIIKDYQERRSSLDHRWIDFLVKLNLHPVLIPNHVNALPQYLENHFDGVLLTGGNDADERTAVETQLLTACIDKKIPVIGVCHGMQFLLSYFGVAISNVSGHVASKHKLTNLSEKSRYYKYLQNYGEVNSYHNLGAMEISQEIGQSIRACAYSEDGILEAIEHKSLPIWGQMWHPEREYPFIKEDLEIFKTHF